MLMDVESEDHVPNSDQDLGIIDENAQSSKMNNIEVYQQGDVWEIFDTRLKTVLARSDK